ncbi:MAG: serine hydrolase domain-containing protein [Gemmatimonadota bacterium]
MSLPSISLPRRSVLVASLACCAPVLLESQRPSGMPPARFADADRATKLAAAFPQIDSVFRAMTQREHVPGAAWGIIVDGKLVHLGVTGVRDADNGSPVDSNTVFRIASMTKSFTAMSILKLRDAGKLSLDDPAEKYVPELKQLSYPTSDSPRITIRMLLSHAEGFPEDNPWGDQQLARTDAELSRMMRRGIPFSTAPGTAYEYSNYGFAILGRIVARVSGVPYREYVSRNILQPLGMHSTTLESKAVPANRLAQGYRWEDNRWKIEPQLPDGAFGSMGGMLTSIHDLGTYVATFLAAWPARDGAETGPVRRASLREMQQIWRPRTPGVTRNATTGLSQLNAGGYGFGLGISSDCDFAHIVAHSGGLPGFGSYMRWLPEYGVGIVAFGNRTYTGWGAPFVDAMGLLEKTGALQPREPQPSRALGDARDAVTRLVLRWNDALADSIASENLFRDRSRDRRREELTALVAKNGPCARATQFSLVENALRGQWVLPCDRGPLRVSITLAPTMPPTVQFLDVAPATLSAPPPRRRLCNP